MSCSVIKSKKKSDKKNPSPKTAESNKSGESGASMVNRAEANTRRREANKRNRQFTKGEWSKLSRSERDAAYREARDRMNPKYARGVGRVRFRLIVPNSATGGDGYTSYAYITRKEYLRVGPVSLSKSNLHTNYNPEIYNIKIKGIGEKAVSELHSKGITKATDIKDIVVGKSGVKIINQSGSSVNVKITKSQASSLKTWRDAVINNQKSKDSKSGSDDDDDD